MDKVELYREALTKYHDKFEFVIYPERPHGFLTFDAASPNYEAAGDAWKRTVAFLHETLGSNSEPVQTELGQ
jgi:dienelactone hydrolase